MPHMSNLNWLLISFTFPIFMIFFILFNFKNNILKLV